MATTIPSLDILSENELAFVDKITKDIDNELRLKFEKGKSTSIRNSIIREIFEYNERVESAVKSIYNADGWTITKYDSVEGAWWSFSE